MTISRARPKLARRLIAAALVMLVSGCSIVSVQRPRSPRRVEDPRVLDDCTRAPAAPILDTVLAAAGLAVGYLAALESSWGSPPGTGPSDLSLAIMGTGALFTGSAVHGHISTGKCRRRVRTGEWCANGDLDACQRLKPGWAPPPEWRPGATLASEK